jgi:hypothetical protein
MGERPVVSATTPFTEPLTLPGDDAVPVLGDVPVCACGKTDSTKNTLNIEVSMTYFLIEKGM